MPPKFGTSGLRGLVTELTDDLVGAHVRAFLHACPQGTAVHVGQDLRPSSPAIAEAVIEAVCAAGLTAIDHGTVPTPALALASMSAGDAAVMITGSHIPADRNGLKFYVPDGEVSKADEKGILAALKKQHTDAKFPGTRTKGTTALPAYVARYADAFGSHAMEGLRIGIYEHSSVARDVMGDIMRAMGAQTVSLARSDVFIPVDTEAVDPDTRGLLAGWAHEHSLDAIISTDGDGDRPMLAGPDGAIIPGDLLGPLTANFLDADTLVTPVSSNTVIDHMSQFTAITRTRIGSPFVIAAMEKALKGGSKTKIVGYEANGGFLLGFIAKGSEGIMTPLMTRDSLLPMIAPLAAASKSGQSLTALVAALPPRFTAADRVQGVPTEKSSAFIEKLRKSPKARKAFFEGVEAETSVDIIDGLRVSFACGSVVHLRPSGNAPECRCYAEADTVGAALTLVETHLQKIRAQLSTMPSKLEPSDQTMKIGEYGLVLPADHLLPRIMEQHPSYDVLYWDILGGLLTENGLAKTCQLIDIGANIGDSAAHFRRHSEGPIWAIEPHPHYFRYLEVNTAKMENIRLSQALFTPPGMVDTISFEAGDGTGMTRLGEDMKFDGAHLHPVQVLAELRTPCMIKSDTDGFDGYIIRALIAQMDATVRPAIITFEGPTPQQVARHEATYHHAALTKLMKQGYRVQVLNNVGTPVSFLGANTQALNWHTRGHRNCTDAGIPQSHYFDYICVAPGLSIDTLHFAPGGLI